MSKGEETRSHVLREALALASEVGLEGVSIGKLAERVGLSKSGLFAHFDSKESLQVQILAEAIARFADLVVAPAIKKARGEPRVRALFENWLKWAVADFMPGGCVFVAASVELDDRPGPARDLLVSSQKDWLGVLAEAARIAVREGHFRSDLDVVQFAHEAYSIAYGHHFVSRLLREPKALQRTRRAFERLIEDARPTSRRGAG
jgi:AcrR family transcriptional regulator